MEHTGDLKGDLEFVAKTVKSSELEGGPSSIYFLWAAISLIGFSLADFRPQWVGNFWSLAGPLGGLISFYLGRRYARAVGQISVQRSWQRAFHWIAMMVAIAMTSTLVELNYLSEKGQGLVILEIVALAYFVAGIYLDKPMRWLGILLAVMFFPIAYYGQHVWSVLAVAFSAGLVMAALQGKRNAATE